MITTDDVRFYVENEFNVDLYSRSRKRKVVYAKVIYAKLCLENVKMKGKYLSKYSVSKSLGMHHATVLHYIKTVFPDIKHYEPKYYAKYLSFNILKVKPKDDTLKEEISALFQKNILLKKELDKFKNTETFDDEVLNIYNSIPDDKKELFIFRIKPIAKMLNSHVTH